MNELILAIMLLGQVAIPTMTVNSQLTFDSVAKDTNGAPVTLASYNVAVFTVADPNAPGALPSGSVLSGTIPAAGIVGQNVALAGLLQGLPNGSYYLTAQVVTSTGAKSAWAAPLQVIKAAGVPLMPSNLKITITVGG